MNRLTLLFPVLLLLVLVTHAQLTVEEKQALVDMKASWPGLATAPTDPWGDPNADDPCNEGWDGLYCNGGGHITQLYVFLPSP